MENVISLSKNKVISIANNGVSIPVISIGLNWNPIINGRVVKKIKKVVYTGNFFQKLFKIGLAELVEDEVVSDKGTEEKIELDSSILIYDSNKSPIETIYFGRRNSSDGAITHSKRYFKGYITKWADNDEVIRIDLSKIDPDTKYLVLIVNNYSRHKLHEVPCINMRIYENKSNNDYISPNDTFAIYQIDNTAFTGKDSVILGVLFRSNENWSFKALGIATNERYTYSTSIGTALKIIKSL